MYTQTILPEKLREFDYYKNKLPLFLQNSHGFIEHFKIWYDLLTGDEHTGLADQADIILYLLNIFDEDYLEFIASLPGSGAGVPDGFFEQLNDNLYGENATQEHIPDSEEYFQQLNDSVWGENSEPQIYSTYGDICDILDKIGAIFGITRKFSCTYVEAGVTKTEEVSLDNQEFLIFIKSQIIKNYCEGTFVQIQDYYDWAGLKIYMMNDTPYAAVKLYLVADTESNYSDNIKKLFLSGMLHIESMGIRYTYLVVTFGDILKWDGIGLHEVWDVGVWAE